MTNFNGSNAYKMRYDDGAAEKKKRIRAYEPDEQKHIRPNMTVKLNRKNESKPVLAAKPLTVKVRSFDPGEVRMIFAAGFAFCVLIAYFVFIIGCQVRDNELSHLIKERQSTLSSLKADYSGLEYKKETLISDAAIEEYAELNLGMQKRDNHQLNWFEVSWDNDFSD